MLFLNLIAKHPIIDFQLQDNFNRRVVDMLDYSTDQAIFEVVMDKTFPDLMRAVADEEYEKG